MNMINASGQKYGGGSGARRESQSPLANVRILDLGVGGVGPWATETLCQLGAEVLKVESPQGDFAHGQYPKFGQQSTSYLALNGGKSAGVLDVVGSGREAFFELLKETDVLVHNFRLGVAERLELDFESLREHFPRLIVASATGFGRGGEYADMRCTDPHAQAFSGFASLNGRPGAPLERFRWYGYIDCTTALVLANAILVRLAERRRTGIGGYVSTSMLASALHLQRSRIAVRDREDGSNRWGSGSPHVVPDKVFRTSDGHIALTVSSVEGWSALGEALPRQHASWDTEWATFEGRRAERASIENFLSTALSQRPSAYWITVLQGSDVTVVRVDRHRDVLKDVDLWTSGALTEVESHVPGRRMVTGSSPWVINGMRGQVQRAPLRDEHSESVRAGRWPASCVSTESDDE